MAVVIHGTFDCAEPMDLNGSAGPALAGWTGWAYCKGGICVAGDSSALPVGKYYRQSQMHLIEVTCYTNQRLNRI